MRIQLFCWCLLVCGLSCAKPIFAQGLSQTAFEAGEQAREEGKFAGALRFYDRAIEADPTHRRALARRGEVQFQLGNREAAMRDLDRAMQLVYPPVKSVNHRLNVHSGTAPDQTQPVYSSQFEIVQLLLMMEAELNLASVSDLSRKLQLAIALAPTDVQVAAFEGRFYAYRNQFGVAAEAFNLATLVAEGSDVEDTYKARLYAAYAYCLARSSTAKTRALKVLQKRVQPIDYSLFTDVNLIIVTLMRWEY